MNGKALWEEAILGASQYVAGILGASHCVAGILGAVGQEERRGATSALLPGDWAVPSS